MKKRNLLIIIVFAFFSVQAIAQNTTSADSIAQAIDYNNFYKHLKYLSSDELKGRDTGSEGYANAAEYVAGKFKENGLKPFGDNNTYFQKVPFIKSSIIKSSIDIKITCKNENTINAIYGENISLLMNKHKEVFHAKQELVFVGYGNVDSSLNMNDYEGVDVKGKTVLVVMGAPKSVKDYTFWDPFLKARNAELNGATGIILCFPQRLIQNMLFKTMHGFLEKPLMTLKDTSLSDQMFDTKLHITAIAKKDLVKKIFKQNDLRFSNVLKKISKGDNQSQYLNSNISCNYKTKVENIDCKNVVGLLSGTDPDLKDEYIVLGAHLDHVGITEPVKGDSICNGMWDNASGSAAVISIAKTFHAANINNKRSIVFICYTGEEKGLLGSNYFAKRKEIEDGQMVANINIDMLGGIFPSKDIIPLGYSYSNLSEAVDFAASALNFEIDDNKEEENNYLFRSDQASFLKLGIPVLNIANGYTAVDPKIDGHKEFDQWMKNIYHSPLDDLQQEYSPEAFLDALKLNFLTTYYIANVLDEIRWNKDSWIYKKYILNEK